jgi:hypothetical protein
MSFDGPANVESVEFSDGNPYGERFTHAPNDRPGTGDMETIEVRRERGPTGDRVTYFLKPNEVDFDANQYDALGVKAVRGKCYLYTVRTVAEEDGQDAETLVSVTLEDMQHATVRLAGIDAIMAVVAERFELNVKN